jgi:hypothetical protein
MKTSGDMGGKCIQQISIFNVVHIFSQSSMFMFLQIKIEDATEVSKTVSGFLPNYALSMHLPFFQT